MRPTIRNLRQTARLMLVLLVSYGSAITWYSWQSAKQDAINTLATITELESKAINSYFDHLASDLLGLAEEVVPTDQAVDLPAAHKLLMGFHRRHAELYNLSLIGADGSLLLSARNRQGTMNVSLANEKSFMDYLEELKSGHILSIGQPMLGLVNKVMFVPVRYAINDREGGLRYVLSANLPLEHLRSFWMEAPITALASIGVIRDDGYLLSRYPVPSNLTMEQIYGKPRTGALINHLRQENYPAAGNVQGASSLSGPDFLTSFRRLQHHDATVFITLPMAEVRATWWHHLRSTYVTLAMLLITSVVVYRYAMRRQTGSDAEQQKLEQVLRISEERFRAIIEASPVPFAVYDEQHNIVHLNQAFTGQFGYLQSDIPTLTDWWPKAYPDPIYRDQVTRMWQARLDESTRSGQAFKPLELSMVAKDGSRRIVMVSASSISISNGGLRLVTLYDITERVKLEQNLRQSETRLQAARQDLLAVQHLAHIGDWSWDVELDTHEWSAEIYLIYDHPVERGPARYPEVGRYFTPASWQALGKAIEKCLAQGGSYTCDAEVLRPDGDHRWVSIFGEAVRGDNGKVVKLRGTVQDITDRQALEAQVRYMAFYDPLTKLANRRLLNDRLSQAMAASKRSGCYGAVLFMDLDNFKPLNDEHGHEAGDLLLQEAAERIKGCVRELDTVARFGGDEFVVMLGELTTDRLESRDQARLVAEKVLAALSQPYRRSPDEKSRRATLWEHRCTASIGIALFIDRECTEDEVLKWADDAMYQAKNAGRNQLRFH